MKKYTDGKREIMITDRAYEVIYKNQGFKEFEQKKIEEVKEEIEKDTSLEIENEVNEEEMKIKKSTKKK